MTNPTSATSSAKQVCEAERLTLEQFLPYRLSIVTESVSRAFGRRYEQQFGLTIPEWRIMAVLGEHRSQTTHQVMDRTRMDRVKTSRAAIKLEAKGLIRRAPKRGDQRAHTLQLSRRGMVVYRQIVPLAHAMQAELVRGFDDAELRAFEAVVDKLLDRADRLAPGPGVAAEA